MNEQSLSLLREVIVRWQLKRHYTFEHKTVSALKNPGLVGEYILYFENSIHGFFCNGELIPVHMRSAPFLTATLSTNPISDNPNADKNRLESLLLDFDIRFYEYVQSKFDECVETLTTSDPLFF